MRVPRSLLSLAALICVATLAPLATAQSSTNLSKFSGEYADASEPDTPLSFYPRDGKLVVETERLMPRELTAASANTFTFERITYTFAQTATGMTVTIHSRDSEGPLLARTGDPVHHLFHDYRRTEAMIPMRDGIKLHAVILVPADLAGPLPFLIERTPYGVDQMRGDTIFSSRPQLARDGYIIVGEDIRGRFKSEGQFFMNRPLADHSNPKATDESTDTYDTVAWLLKNVPNNNGRAGFLGTSYPGFLAIMAGIDPHPAVKAISPQAPMIDAGLGDDFFHFGAFRQSYGYDYGLMMETDKENAEVSYGKTADGAPVDGYDFFLKRGSFLEDTRQSGSKMLPTWQAFLSHPSYDDYWRARGVEHHLDTVAVPTLTVGGYYDQEDMWGPQEEYARLEPHDSGHQNFLVLGPWRHGSWAQTTRHLGALQYGAPIGEQFRSQIEAKFFAHYLKDAPGTNPSGFDLVDTASFQTGSNTWKRYGHFPPVEARPTRLCLGGNGQLALGSPCTTGKVSYVSDPANPVPYRHLPIQPTYGPGSQWYTWLVEDQRFVTGRPDVATWRLPVQDHDLTVTGEVLADLYASTTGSDADFAVKLIDQYPDDDPDPTMRGYQLMTNMEIMRGRYRTGYDQPEALKPGEINEFRWTLHDVDHVFKKGHTVLVQVQSTWFPLYDRNPQTFVPNIMTARPEDYKSATISIVEDANHPSAIILTVMP